jgi:Ser/Thr protein kinase RdoA (MazF antagonist)
MPHAGPPFGVPQGYASLTPQQVLDALDCVGLPGDGRILQLNSYENRVFQLFLEDSLPAAAPGAQATSAVVAKFYRPGRWSNAQIIEEHAFALELAAAEVPVVPPLVLQVPGDTPMAGLELHGQPPTLACLQVDDQLHRYTVAARCAGREPELDQPDTLRQIGRFIGRLHSVGRQRRFQHRHMMQPRADGDAALALLLGSSSAGQPGGFVTDDMRAAWEDAARRALDAVCAAFESLQPLDTLRLHGDCHPGNVLWRHTASENGPHMVDLDDACMGPAVQDLWMLVSGDAHSMRAQQALLLEGYEQFSDFNDAELRLVEPLRTLRMLRHSAWLAARWTDPSFPLNFPFFGTSAYWSQQITQLREQLELMER